MLGWPGSVCLFPSPVLNYRDKMPLMLVQAELDRGSHFPFFLSLISKSHTQIASEAMGKDISCK